MSRRWIYWFAGMLALGLIALLPLRIAMGRFEAMGFTARQVAGSIWYGRIGELSLRNHRIGTFEVALAPLALLTGAVKLDFRRLDDPQGVLDGALVAGASRGMRDTTGRIAAAGLFGALPIEAIELEDATLLFKGQRCARATGKARVLIASSLPGVDGVAFAGSPRCEGERIRFMLSTPSGAGRLDFYVRSSGEYRGWLHVRGADPSNASALAGAGFAASPEGMMLSVDGKL